MKQDKRPWHSYYVSPTRPEIDKIEYKNLPEMIRESSQKFKNKKAFIACMPNGMNGTLTYGEVDQLSDAFAVYLRENLKLKEGDRVALQMPNCLVFPIVAFGVFKAGCILVNTNPLYSSSEMQHQFNNAGIKALVIIDMFADKFESIQSNVKVERVVVCRLSDFFPTLVSKVINLTQKYWNKQIPVISMEHTPFKEAISWGLKRLDQKKLATYLENINNDSVAILQYTGGTTGVSKGTMLTHNNLLANRAQILEMLQNKIENATECILTALPLYHIFAFSVNLITFYSVGGENILIPSPRPLSNLKRAFENYPITWLTGVNTLFNGLCHELWFRDNPPKKLKASASGGMALLSIVAERWIEVTQSPIVEGYGLTETSPVITFNPFGGKVKSSSIGIPLPSTDVRCVKKDGTIAQVDEAGELEAKGPQVMKGYWENEKETLASLSADGWVKTGDIASMDSEGYFKIIDRKKDMVIVSGFNVFPNEVEECLSKHPKVLEAAVVGVLDSEGTEIVKAYIVKKNRALTAEEVTAHCKEHLTAYKIPKLIEFRETLPKSPIGKILRKDLRKEHKNG